MSTFSANNPIFFENDFIIRKIKQNNSFHNKEELKESKPEKNEVEVYRLSPEEGKYYKTATYTRKTGLYRLKNEKYYTTNPLKYVGLFIRTKCVANDGCGEVWSIFDNNGEEVKVQHTYEGTTCFVETRSQ